MEDNELPLPGKTEKEKKEEVKAGSPGINRDVIFYYSRERRLERASPAVRAFNDENPVKRPLSRRLFGSRGNAFIFFAIALLFVIYTLTNRLAGSDKNVKLSGNTLDLTISRENDVPVLEIKKTPPEKGGAYLGTVDIAVSPVMPKTENKDPQELPPVFSHRVFFRSNDPETFSISIPFSGNDFFIILRTSDDHKLVKLKVK